MWRRTDAVDGGGQMHLVRPIVATLARDAQGDMGQGRIGHARIVRHPSQRDDPPGPAITTDSEKVVPHRADMAGQSERAVIGRLD